MAATAADGVGARGRLERWEEEAAGDQRAWLRGRVRTAWLLEVGGEKKKPLEISELGCADGCGWRGCKGVGGNGLGEEAAGDERAWLRGRLRTA